MIFKIIIRVTHLLTLLDKMCKYVMDPISIVEDTERTLFCPQTDRQADGQTDRWKDGKGETSTPPFNFVEGVGLGGGGGGGGGGGYNNSGENI